jgi:hypothetical protein
MPWRHQSIKSCTAPALSGRNNNSIDEACPAGIRSSAFAQPGYGQRLCSHLARPGRRIPASGSRF